MIQHLSPKSLVDDDGVFFACADYLQGVEFFECRLSSLAGSTTGMTGSMNLQNPSLAHLLTSNTNEVRFFEFTKKTKLHVYRYILNRESVNHPLQFLINIPSCEITASFNDVFHV